MNEFNRGRFLNRALRSIVQAQVDEYQEVYTAKIAEGQAIAINQAELKRRRILQLELMLIGFIGFVLALAMGVGFIATAESSQCVIGDRVQQITDSSN